MQTHKGTKHESNRKLNMSAGKPMTKTNGQTDKRRGKRRKRGGNARPLMRPFCFPTDGFQQGNVAIVNKEMATRKEGAKGSIFNNETARRKLTNNKPPETRKRKSTKGFRVSGLETVVLEDELAAPLPGVGVVRCVGILVPLVALLACIAILSHNHRSAPSSAARRSIRRLMTLRTQGSHP
jgi:hypothetical protein